MAMVAVLLNYVFVQVRPLRRPAPEARGHQHVQERLHLLAAQPGIAAHIQETTFQVSSVGSFQWFVTNQLWLTFS